MPGPLVEALDADGNTVGVGALQFTLPPGVAISGLRWAGGEEPLDIPASPHPHVVVVYPKLSPVSPEP